MAVPGPDGAKELRVVAMGGGTGLSTLLRGLKQYVPMRDRRKGPRAGEQARATIPSPDARWVIRELSAVVTVTDDGGSSGRLREDFKMLPPGDVRNCMVALSEDEHLLSKLFRYRFDQGDLNGHSFGNLFVAALSHITGDFAQAVQTLVGIARLPQRGLRSLVLRGQVRGHVQLALIATGSFRSTILNPTRPRANGGPS